MWAKLKILTNTPSLKPHICPIVFAIIITFGEMLGARS